MNKKKDKWRHQLCLRTKCCTNIFEDDASSLIRNFESVNPINSTGNIVQCRH